MAKTYDVVIIGAGPAGIFTALELADTGLSILILEKGLDIRERIALNKNRTAPPASRAGEYRIRLGRGRCLFRWQADPYHRIRRQPGRLYE